MSPQEEIEQLQEYIHRTDRGINGEQRFVAVFLFFSMLTVTATWLAFAFWASALFGLALVAVGQRHKHRLLVRHAELCERVESSRGLHGHKH